MNALDVVEDKPKSTFIDGVDITNLDGVVNGGEMNVPSDISLEMLFSALEKLSKKYVDRRSKKISIFLIVDTQTCPIRGGSH